MRRFRIELRPSGGVSIFDAPDGPWTTDGFQWPGREPVGPPVLHEGPGALTADLVCPDCGRRDRFLVPTCLAMAFRPCED